ELLAALGRHKHNTKPSFHEQIDRTGKSKFRSNQRTMKSSTLVAVLLLQTVMVMGILAHSQPADAHDDFPKCCDHCNSWSGAQFCDDVGPKCRRG
uniref:Bowman-Birk serine protease inhibitors family domain-containing protein n=1 Tax=Aegilops tauschii subsp. strangulata TaxID=200361 RepID=A0A453M7Q7_AEGTS